LQEKVPPFRHTPWWMDRLLDNPAAQLPVNRAGSVDPMKLGDLTVSMLRGVIRQSTQGSRKLVHWLLTDIKPDIIHYQTPCNSAWSE
jgi:hypothetical protein